jgi:hypothetical protein
MALQILPSGVEHTLFISPYFPYFLAQCLFYAVNKLTFASELGVFVTMMNIILNILYLRWIMFCRKFKEYPLLYGIFFGVMLFFYIFTFINIDISFTPTNGAVAALVYVALYRLLFARKKQMLFLRQLGSVQILFSAINLFLCALPFLLAGYRFFLLALAVGVICLLAEKLTLRYKYHNRISLVLPSVFLKSSYLWHSQSRPYLVLYWALLCLVLFFAQRYDNFNLAIAVFCGINLFAILAVILQYESISFVRQYSTVKYFATLGLLETCANTTWFLLAPALFFLCSFPAYWHIIALAMLAIYVFAVGLLWIKYLFWGVDPFIVCVFIVLFFFVQGFLLVSVYGIPVALLFQYLLYKKFYTSVQILLCYEEVKH